MILKLHSGDPLAPTRIDTLSDIEPCLMLHLKTIRKIVNEENRYRMKIAIISKKRKASRRGDEPKCKRQRLENESTSAPPTPPVESNVAENDLPMIESEDDPRGRQRLRP